MRGLLPDAPVDAFTQQVRVTAVPRILLDPVHQDLSYCDAVLADAFAEVLVTGKRGVGFRLLSGQSGPSSIDHVLVGDRVVEVRVALTVDLCQRRTVGDPVALVPFRLCEVAEQSEQRHS